MAMQLPALKQLYQASGRKPRVQEHGWVPGTENLGPAQAADWAMWVRRSNLEEAKNTSLPHTTYCGG